MHKQQSEYEKTAARETDFGSYCTSDKMNLAAAKMRGIYSKLGVPKSPLITLLSPHHRIEINMGWTDHGM